MRVKAPVLVGWCAMSLLFMAGLADGANDPRLIQAIKSGQKDVVRSLVRERIDVNAPQSDGTTPLHWAVQRDDVDSAVLLIGAGAKPNVKNDYGVTPLSLACTNANPAMVDLLLRSGADASTPLPSGETPLMTASRTGNINVVKSIIERGANVNATESARGQTPLMWAAAEDHSDIVKLLLERGADVHAKSQSGQTALHFAARDGDLETTKALLAAGAKVNEPSGDGSTAFTIAVIRSHAKYAQYLLDQGAYVDAGPGFTPLHWAVGDWSLELAGDNTFVRPEGSEWDAVLGLRGKEKMDLVEMLLWYGADVNAVAQSTPRYSGGRSRGGKQAGANAMLMAAQHGDVPMMRLLRSYGADPLVVSANNVSCIMFASGLHSDFSIGYTSIKEKDALEAAQYCYEMGDTNVNRQEKFGDTALHGAAYRGLSGASSIMEFLISKGADPNMPNKRRWTPVTIAEGVYTNNSNSRNPEHVATLMKHGGRPSPANIERDWYSVIDEGSQGTIGTQAIPTAIKPPETIDEPKK